MPVQRGPILLNACDERLRLSETLAACLSDHREQSRVAHSLRELFQQRLFVLACGYADGNDAARLAEDPVVKLLTGRDPVAGGSLASQPTLSRFENSVRPGDLLRLSEALAERVIARHRRRKKRVRRIAIDLDPTVDPTHGGQQLTFFNGFYDTSCYLPLAGFLTFDDEVEQYLFCYVLRPGDCRKSFEGTQAGPGDRPHQLHALPGQPVPRSDDGGRLYADVGTSREGSVDDLRARSGQHFAATLPEAGRLDRNVGSDHRHPSAAGHPAR